ncbi:MAG: hypothetical protein A3C81_00130 [Candidatus Yanofskybacteria bacterium RIFCSPHIGHO2_02_FULL_46_19]|uniref:Type II secretion system protein GspG C-terminal domain-containing protein n=1 Tax=Candidatus Yanofskybacteria bacterium RIFCSPHIGHO2_02_FULL_46_19 TaxID=1802684 RepID=A0A1F8FSB2_9BACT|nr:MAG: hypothetical protein A3C81_00130 [Candidatus Yanofskybacteria bacterium RIFCSPHIGHO2_02_FULL_46_19]
MKKHQHGGFTLVELLVVVGIIAIIASVVFVTLEPARRFGDARNARRWSETVSILNAIIKYQIDNNGAFPGDIYPAWGTPYMIGSGGAGAVSCGATTTPAGGALSRINLSTSTASHLAQVPVDPGGGTAANTGYYLSRTAVVVIGTCSPENGASIFVAR